MYYLCVHGKPELRQCPTNTVWDVEKNICNWPNSVTREECHEQIAKLSLALELEAATAVPDTSAHSGGSVEVQEVDASPGVASDSQKERMQMNSQSSSEEAKVENESGPQELIQSSKDKQQPLNV